jgi:hypothetical protein
MAGTAGVCFVRVIWECGAVPFTASHPAAVVPLMRWGLVPSALVIGSMAPDIPYFLPLPTSLPIAREASHSLVGILTVDVPLGLAAFAVWQAVVASAVVAIAPAGLRSRLGPASPAGLRHHLTGVRRPALVLLSLAVGALTHVVWDAFTHSGSWGTARFDVLRTFYGPLPLYRWAQYASGLVGGAVLVAVAVRWWRATPPRAEARDVHRAAGRRVALGVWTAVLVATAVAGAVAAAGPLTAVTGTDWRAAAFQGITRGGSAGGLALVGFAVAWALRARGSAGDGGGRAAAQ